MMYDVGFDCHAHGGADYEDGGAKVDSAVYGTGHNDDDSPALHVYTVTRPARLHFYLSFHFVCSHIRQVRASVVTNHGKFNKFNTHVYANTTNCLRKVSDNVYLAVGACIEVRVKYT